MFDSIAASIVLLLSIFILYLDTPKEDEAENGILPPRVINIDPPEFAIFVIAIALGGFVFWLKVFYNAMMVFFN